MRLQGTNGGIEIRGVTTLDMPLLLSFIRKMAEFERLAVSATEADLTAALGGTQPAAKALLAFVGGSPAAYAVYYFGFSTMTGKRMLHLEDIFVLPEFRRRGIASALMAHLARVACDAGCVRFEWIVLDWNERAIDFYEELGAVVLPDWRICRVEGKALACLAGSEEGARSPGGAMDAAS